MNKINFIKLLVLAFLISSCNKETCTDGIQNGTETAINCGGDCSKCLSAEKKILNISFGKAPSGFDPGVKIDNDKLLINIFITKAHPNENISNLTMTFETSPGASVLSNPKNFTAPVDVGVKAEDGSIQTYKIIVTQVYGSHKVIKNGITSISDILSVYFNVSLLQVNNDINFSFFPKPKVDPTCFFNLTIKNKNLATSIVGNYNVKYINPNPHLCHFTYQPDIFGSTTLYSPENGIIQITKHDLNNKLVSGKVSNLHYKAVIGSDQFYPYLEFTNMKYD